MNTRRLLLLAAFLAAGAAGAATVIPADLAALSRSAEVIVVGRCLESRTLWSADHTRIYTDTTVEVGRAVKGASGAKLVVRQLGGEIDGKGMIAAGVVRLVPGEEAVLFLTPEVEGVRRIYGLHQGRLTVATDPATGRKTVSPGPALLPPARGQSTPPPAAISLDVFLAEVQRLAEAGR